MKRTVLLLSFALISSIIAAQAPEAFKYQAVVRDNSGNLISEQVVGIQIDILKGATDGTSVYTETHSETTNTYGLVNLEIGSGTSTDDFSDINWGDDEYFIQISLDATGGTSYELMGTSQLLSVPYSLYASVADTVLNESQILSIDGDTLSISSGNSVIFPSSGEDTSNGNLIVTFVGDITDVEAVEKIAKEVGPNTKYIWVKNASQLTTLNLKGAVEVLEIQVQHNSSLHTLTIPDLKGCRSLSLYNNPSLTELNANELLVAQTIPISSCGQLNTVVFSKLESVYGTISFEDCPEVSSLLIENLFDGSLRLNNCKISSLSVPDLRYAENFTISNCPSLTNLDISNLRKVKSNFSIGGFPLLTSITLNLENVGNFTFSNCPSVTSLDLSTLDSVGNLAIQNLGISEISFPLLQTITTMHINACSGLSSIDISNITRFGMFEAKNNALPSDEINSLLAHFVTLLPDSPSMIWINGQNPPAPPTGQGITDKATLIADGKDVQTD